MLDRSRALRPVLAARGWLPQGSAKPVLERIPAVVQHLAASGWWQHLYSRWRVVAVVTSPRPSSGGCGSLYVPEHYCHL